MIAEKCEICGNLGTCTCNFQESLKNATVIKLDKSPKTVDWLIYLLCKGLEINSKSRQKEKLTKIIKTVIYSERDKLRDIDKQEKY